MTRSRTRRLALPALLVLLPAGCLELDTSQPIYLVPGADWSEVQAQVISIAAGLWNAEVGTAISVSRDPPADSQQVPVVWSDLVCAYHAGVTTYPNPRIGVCTLDASPLDVLMIVRHEIGHALGVLPHADDPLAVMAAVPSGEGTHFRPEDRQLFEEANPEHVDQRGACGAVSDLAWSPYRPTMVQPPGQAPVVLWSDDDALRYVALDAAGRPAGATKQITTAGAPQWIRASPHKEGFVVTWEQGKHRHVSRVRLPGGAPTAAVRLGLGTLSTESRLYLSEVAIGDDLYVAITDQLDAGPDKLAYRARLARLDLTSGKAKTFTSPVSKAWCRLATAKDAPLLACRTEGSWLDGTPGSAAISRLSPSGAVLDTLDLGSVFTVTVTNVSSGKSRYESTLHLQGGDQRAYVVVNRTYEGLTIHRVDTSGTLTLAKSRDLRPPARRGNYLSLATRVQGGGLQLAGSFSRLLSEPGAVSAALHDEVHLVTLDPLSLQTSKDWRLVSPEGVTYSAQPQLGEAGGRLVVMWRDQQGEPDLVRSRCMP